MTRRVDAKRLIVAGGLALALAGCATHGRTGAGTDAAGGGPSDASASGLAGGGTGAGGMGVGGSGSERAAVGAPGATLFSALPSPKDFGETAALRDIHFDFDRADFRPEDARVLDANARWLVAHPGTLVLIEGHADERGTNEYNMALGESRARVAREQLVARGVAAGRITLVSYGEERPACHEASEACWASNRRAHFLVKSSVTVSALQR